MNRRRFGRWAEKAALVLLLIKGYRLRDRNWSGAGGELDLVMEKGEEIVFVEVKARSSMDYGGAAAAVGQRKREVLVRTASAYLSRFGLWHRQCRFDVVILEPGSGLLPWYITQIRNAFAADLGRVL